MVKPGWKLHICGSFECIKQVRKLNRMNAFYGHKNLSGQLGRRLLMSCLICGPTLFGNIPADPSKEARGQSQPRRPLHHHVKMTANNIQSQTLTYLINEIKQLSDIIGNGWEIWVGPLQMFFINFAHPLHALVDGLVVGVGSRLGLDTRLYQQDCVSHGFGYWIISEMSTGGL